MRVGVIGPLGPDYFAENVSDALKRGGHIVTHLGTTIPRRRSQLLTTSRMLAWQELPGLDEGGQWQIVRAAVTAYCTVIWLIGKLRGDPVTPGPDRRTAAPRRDFRLWP